jgi:hypothetical protein
MARNVQKMAWQDGPSKGWQFTEEVMLWVVR